MAPYLVLLNGIPASGKSTLGREWCSRHAANLPLCLDVDALRAMIGGWQSAPLEAGHAARDLAVAAISAHLGSGRDVVVPQYLRRVEFIDRLASVASVVGAVFVETALVIDSLEAERRFRSRVASAKRDVWGGLDNNMDAIAAEFATFLDERPRTVRINAGPKAVDSLEDAVHGQDSDSTSSDAGG